MKKQSIIILHGWGLSAEKFDALKRVLISRGFDAYSMDMPGFGRSAAPKDPLMLEDYAHFVRDYIKKHDIVRPIVLGHSFGGRVALKLQKLYPGSLRALILTGTPGFTPVSRKRLFLFIAIAKIGKLITSMFPFGVFREATRRWYYYVVGAREYYRANGTMRQTFKNIVQEELISCMRTVTIPCVLVWGELDTVTPLSIAKRMKQIIVGAKLIVIPGADHGVVFKKPDVFVAFVEDFLRNL